MILMWFCMAVKFEDHRLRVFEKMLRRVFGLKRDEVMEYLRKLHNAEL
jgi:hypothetical protein